MNSAFEVFNDPDVILAQTQAGISSSPLLQAQVQAGAVTSIGGATGTTITVTSSGSSGFSLSASGTPGQLSFSISVSSAATARTSLGLGALAVLNAGSAVANLSTVASAAYVQAEAQAVIDKVNSLLNSLRTAGIIAT